MTNEELARATLTAATERAVDAMYVRLRPVLDAKHNPIAVRNLLSVLYLMARQDQLAESQRIDRKAGL